MSAATSALKLASLSRASQQAVQAGRSDWSMHLYHGMLGRKEHWLPCVDLMSGVSSSSTSSMLSDVISNYHCYDMRNHGETLPRTSTHSCDLMCLDISKTLLELHGGGSPEDSSDAGGNIEKKKKNNILVAHSMGGAAVMNYLVTKGKGSSGSSGGQDGGAICPAYDSVKAAVVVDMYPFPERPFFADQATKDLARLVALAPELATLKVPQQENIASSTAPRGTTTLTRTSALREFHTATTEKMLKKIIYNSTLRSFIKDALVPIVTSDDGQEGGGGGGLGETTTGLQWEPNVEVMSRDVEAFLKFPIAPEALGLESGGSDGPAVCDIPVLFIYGAKSDYTQRNKAGAKNIPKYFSNYEEVVVPNSGHFVFHDQPERFCEVLGDFVSRIVLTSGV